MEPLKLPTRLTEPLDIQANREVLAIPRRASTARLTFDDDLISSDRSFHLTQLPIQVYTGPKETKALRVVARPRLSTT